MSIIAIAAIVNGPMSGPLSSAVSLSECVPSDVLGVSCCLFVVGSDLCVEVSTNKYVRVRLPALISVLPELGMHLLHAFVSVSRET